MNIHQVSRIQKSNFILALMNHSKKFMSTKRCWVHAGVSLAILIGLAYSSRAQSCPTCKDENPTIGFTGSVCSAHDYTVTLNGITLNGFGSCTADTWVTMNKAYTQLTVDKTYLLTAGTDSCSTHIVFDVPEHYKLEVDGIEKAVIDKSGGTTKGSGDGTWKIVVRKRCQGCEGAGFGNPGKTNLGSVDWSVSMGNLSDGRWAQSINIIQDTLSSAIYTPAALIYSPPGLTNEVDVVQNPDQSLRQIKTTEGLADIVVTIAGQEYEIRFYRPADMGAKVNGIYTVAGQPYITWKIKNPDPSSTARLQISKTQGSFTDTSEYAWDAVTNSWTLRRGGGTSLETKVITYPTATSRNETTTVKESNGQIVSKVVRTHHSFSWGEELLQEIVDPDGAALKTVYTYYQNSTEAGRYAKVKSIEYSDGSWEKYDYDTSGNRTVLLRPWKDLALASATEANSYVSRYTYSNFDGVVTSLYARGISSIEEQIAGVTVRKTAYTRSGMTINANPATRQVETIYAAAGATQTTTTTRYHYSAAPFYANRVISVEYADGKSDAHTYEKGNYVSNPDPSLSQFTPDANGAAQRETLVRGTVISPAGVAFKTMKETSIRDPYGRVVLQECYVYDGASYERVGWTAMDYNDLGQLTQTRRHNGEVITNVWSGDRKVSQSDANGTQTDYTYDALVRVKTQTKKGVAASGSFPAQVDIVTTYNYDAEGHTVGETISGGSLSLTKTRAYDLSGRTKSETDNAGLTTNDIYGNGGRSQTIIRPGGATEITDNYLDGQTKSVTGTGVVSRYFDYGVNADGTRYTQVFVGNSGLSSPRWTRTTTDWLGRTVRVEKPSFTGVLLVQTSTYNNKGQLSKETSTANGNRLLAEKLYDYDELGNRVRAGADIDANGALTLASTDRISEANTVYEKLGNDWFRVTTNSTYLADNGGTPTSQTQRERLNNFPLNGTEQTVSESSAIDVAGNSIRTTATIDRAAKKATTTTDTLDSNIDGVSVSFNGLLQSSTTTTPQSATTYAYDGLGRQVGVTDPRTGTTTQAYEQTNGRLLSTSDAVSTTTYEYYPAAHVNAGRMKAQTNANSKKIYFQYSTRGELIRNWGDTTYPIEYVYDSYGQKTELHTFRSGQNWTTSVWPATITGATDVTKWIYQDSTGLVAQKQDPALKGATYTYDELGRIKTRTWARAIGCNYSYDLNTGELTGVSYSDNTPAVTFAYDRGGRQKTITDVAGAHTRTFTASGELQTEQIVGGVLDGINLNVGYDAFLRRSSLQSSSGANVLSSQAYGYDTASRLQVVTSGSQTATYAFYPNSGLLNTTTFTSGTQIARGYDSLGRLQSIATTTPSSGTVASYSYQYNNLHQRIRVTREDGSYWLYSYNDRGELISGKKFWADNTPVWGDQTEYSFDNIGNRNYAKNGGNQLGGLRQSNYTANSLNQYSQRSVPGAVDITGTANSAATVTVNNQASARKGDYFYQELAVSNAGGPVSQQVTVVGARQNFGAGGEDAVTQQGGHVFVPQVNESFAYDFDGNVTSDGRWNYSWDAENRLVSMEAIPTVPVEAKQRLEFAYDGTARRIQKKMYAWDIGTSSYQLQSTTKFVYDGWNLCAELDGNNNVVRSYVRGGGELLLINGGGDSHQVGYDGNQNVGVLVKASTGAVSAAYDYDPFGQTVKAAGEFASQNPIRFSSQYADVETALIYYGYRYYNPETGRWFSRDPIEEKGADNLYGFVNNHAVDRADYLGLIEVGQIADLMRNKSWLNGEVLLRKWMAASANTNPTNGAPDTTTIKMDSWVLTFGRAKAVYDKIFSDKVFSNNAAQKAIIDVLKRTGKLGRGYGHEYEPFDFTSGAVIDIDKDRLDINYRPVGDPSSDDVDDMLAAIGRFTLKMTVKGSVCADWVVYVNEVGVYLKDSYDFNDDQGAWFSQPLGYWNPSTGYVGKNPLRGDTVTNRTFQEYRKRTGNGGDFLVYSDMKTTKLGSPEMFMAR